MELSYLVDNLKSLLVRYTSENIQIEENLHELFTSFEVKNFNKEIHLTSEPVLKDNFNYIYSLGDLLKIFEDK